MRTQKTVGSTTYNYIWADGKLVNQSWGNNNLHFYYEQDGAVIGFDYNGEKYSYIKNLQDDIVGVIDASGNIVASYSYDTWGALLSSSDSMADINPMRYKGYYYDSDTGMYYLQSRYYDPSLKRFINADDAELIADLALESVLGGNIFAYCENNAVNASDPTGTVSLSTIGSFIWKVFVEMLPIVGLLGLAKKFVSLIASFNIPIVGKIKAIAKILKAVYYIACITNDIISIYKHRNSVVYVVAYTTDLICDTFKLVGSIIGVKIQKILNAFKKRKSDLYDVLHALNVVFGNAWFGCRYLGQIANRLCS